VRISTFKSRLMDRRNIYIVVAITGLLSVWKLVSVGYSPVVLPSPEDAMATLGKMMTTQEFWRRIYRIFLRIATGYSLSLLIGTAIGMAMGFKRDLNSTLSPVISILQTTPNISWILLAIIWFGLNSRIIIFTIFISTLPIFVINARQGVVNTDSELLEMGDIYQLGRFVRFRKIYLPSAKPYILSAGEITIERAWKIGAMAELLSLNTGIGAGLYWARNNLETDRIFAWTIVLILLGYFSSTLLRRLFGRKKTS